MRYFLLENIRLNCITGNYEGGGEGRGGGDIHDEVVMRGRRQHGGEVRRGGKDCMKWAGRGAGQRLAPGDGRSCCH